MTCSPTLGLERSHGPGKGRLEHGVSQGDLAQFEGRLGRRQVGFDGGDGLGTGARLDELELGLGALDLGLGSVNVGRAGRRLDCVQLRLGLVDPSLGGGDVCRARFGLERVHLGSRSAQSRPGPRRCRRL